MTVKSFKTDFDREVTLLQALGDAVRLRIDDLIGGQDSMYLRLTKAEQQQLITLLTEGELPDPDPRPGDIVRFRPENAPEFAPCAAEAGALARVKYVDSRWVTIEWIDERAGTQSNGGYSKKCLEVVPVDELTNEDRLHILNRALGMG